MVRAFTLFVVLGCVGLKAEEAVTPVVVTPETVSEHVGKAVTVKGKVEGQKSSKTGNTFLNFGGKFPNHIFSCVCRAKNFPEPLPPFEGKVVEVTGMVTIYEGKPSMELTSLKEIRVVEEVPPAEGTPSSPAP